MDSKSDRHSLEKRVHPNSPGVKVGDVGSHAKALQTHGPRLSGHAVPFWAYRVAWVAELLLVHNVGQFALVEEHLATRARPEGKVLLGVLHGQAVRGHVRCR